MNLRSFDLNLLLVLDALLREGSTVKAGERIGLSQPAVSAALSRLRHALDDPLFVRHGQGLVPTDYACELAIPLRVELDRLQALLAPPAAFDPSGASLTFRLAGSDFFGELLMPALAAHLGKVAPGVRVHLVDLVPERYVDSLERYEADIALVPDEPLPDWLEKRPLFHSGFVVIARKDHPEIRLSASTPGSVLPLDTFCSLPHILFSPQGRISAMGDAALAAVGRSRKVIMTLPWFMGVCRAVSQSDALALVPQQFAEVVAQVMGLDLYQSPVPLGTPQIIATWHRRTSANPAHHWMRDLVVSILSPLDTKVQAT